MTAALFAFWTVLLSCGWISYDLVNWGAVRR